MSGSHAVDAPDRLGLRVQALATADHVRAAALVRLPVDGAPPSGVILVADGAGRLAAAGALAVIGADLARPVAVIRSGEQVPLWATADAQVVVLAGAAAPEVHDRPVLRLPAAPAPLDPRAAVSAEVVALWALLAALRVAPDPTSAIEAAADQLDGRAATAAGHGLGQARTSALARRIGRTFVLAQGAGLGALAAERLRQRIQTDAKSPAWATDLGDADTAERHGWGQHGDVSRQVLTVVRCRHDHEPEGTAEMIARYEPDLIEVTAGVEDLVAGGEGRLAQLLDLFLQADLLALALAGQEGLDPG